MSTPKKDKEGFVQAAQVMYEELYEWREKHSEATFDEIASQVTPRRRELMGELLAQLACQYGDGTVIEGASCPDCGEAMRYKGRVEREIEHLEGETEIARAYYHCTHCKSGYFPLDDQLYLGKHSWTPETVKQMVRQAIEIPSYRRAAESYQEMTKIPVSKSSLARLVNQYGGQLVAQQKVEAEETVKPPAKEEVVTERQIPKPDSEVMNVSMDGAMVNIRDEGWKEVKVVAISAVERETDEETGEIEVNLSQHSYRAGLWEAKEFGKQQWAEGCRRGLERAKEVVSVNDGAFWIWIIIQMCWAPCVEILDWWHLIEKLWTTARGLFDGDETGSTNWMKKQKEHLWNSEPRQVLRAIRTLCPRGEPLPEPVRLTVNYIFTNRQRIRYKQFRETGYPIGSGTVESACKLVVQTRMKQAGMRWSRDGAQAMLALRCILLSERWDEIWNSFRPPP